MTNDAFRSSYKSNSKTIVFQTNPASAHTLPHTAFKSYDLIDRTFVMLAALELADSIEQRKVRNRGIERERRNENKSKLGSIF